MHSDFFESPAPNTSVVQSQRIRDLLSECFQLQDAEFSEDPEQYSYPDVQLMKSSIDETAKKLLPRSYVRRFIQSAREMEATHVIHFQLPHLRMEFVCAAQTSEKSVDWLEAVYMLDPCWGLDLLDSISTAVFDLNYGDEFDYWDFVSRFPDKKTAL